MSASVPPLRVVRKQYAAMAELDPHRLSTASPLVIFSTCPDAMNVEYPSAFIRWLYHPSLSLASCPASREHACVRMSCPGRCYHGTAPRTDQTSRFFLFPQPFSFLAYARRATGFISWVPYPVQIYTTTQLFLMHRDAQAHLQF